MLIYFLVQKKFQNKQKNIGKVYQSVFFVPFYNLKCQIGISKLSQLLTVILPYFSHYAYCYFMFSHNNEVAIHDLIIVI